jgi:hypothetical protein
VPVRGDRSGTGGVRKAKLTEEELSAKLEAMKIKNAALVAAYEASLADAESFEQREALAAQKRREEGVRRRELMGEREENRIRKLKAVGGREWDAGKEEREREEEKGGFRRGAYGGVVGERPQRDQPRTMEDEESHRGGRREWRGGRGRRGGHRGGYSQQQQQHEVKGSTQAQALPKVEDFPELPATSKPKEESKPPPKVDLPQKKTEARKPSPKDTTTNLNMVSLEPTKDKRSWADQVESP